uniref:Uncharacterized protein n=1 Tax=Oryza sativa subsp. japonica TaxID=39947 RepID=Q6YWB0_ORYSJ|nr:hypothetical protein [Oryza sativa Japonica Group]BAD17576.1 hypothetical protein [Oryza sativa Japonica Group]
MDGSDSLHAEEVADGEGENPNPIPDSSPLLFLIRRPASERPNRRRWCDGGPTSWGASAATSAAVAPSLPAGGRAWGGAKPWRLGVLAVRQSGGAQAAVVAVRLRTSFFWGAEHKATPSQAFPSWRGGDGGKIQGGVRTADADVTMRSSDELRELQVR